MYIYLYHLIRDWGLFQTFIKHRFSDVSQLIWHFQGIETNIHISIYLYHFLVFLWKNTRNLSIYLSIYLSLYLSIYPPGSVYGGSGSIYLSFYLYTYLSYIYLSISLSIYLSIHQARCTEGLGPGGVVCPRSPARSAPSTSTGSRTTTSTGTR